MNLIEAQCHQLKTHEMAGRIFDNEIFDNEYDLANAMIEGIENRGQQGGWILERLTFKSA